MLDYALDEELSVKATWALHASPPERRISEMSPFEKRDLTVIDAAKEFVVDNSYVQSCPAVV